MSLDPEVLDKAKQWIEETGTRTDGTCPLCGHCKEDPSQDESPTAPVLRAEIGNWAFMKNMGLIFWESVRHPFSTSTIDLTNTRVLARE